MPPPALECSILLRSAGETELDSPESFLTRRLHRALVVLGRCSHIMPEAARVIEVLVITIGVSGGVRGKSCSEVQVAGGAGLDG